MHILKEHYHINDNDLKRIGDIDLDIKVRYQWSFKNEL